MEVIEEVIYSNLQPIQENQENQENQDTVINETITVYKINEKTKEKNRQRMREYRLKNKDKINARRRELNKLYRERIIEKNKLNIKQEKKQEKKETNNMNRYKTYRKQNEEYINTKIKLRREKHREKYRQKKLKQQLISKDAEHFNIENTLKKIEHNTQIKINRLCNMIFNEYGQSITKEMAIKILELKQKNNKTYLETYEFLKCIE